jgi:hypothetical protein
VNGRLKRSFKKDMNGNKKEAIAESVWCIDLGSHRDRAINPRSPTFSISELVICGFLDWILPSRTLSPIFQFFHFLIGVLVIY